MRVAQSLRLLTTEGGQIGAKESLDLSQSLQEEATTDLRGRVSQTKQLATIKALATEIGMKEEIAWEDVATRATLAEETVMSDLEDDLLIAALEADSLTGSTERRGIKIQEGECQIEKR
jgi:hypothetical protein